MCTALRVPLAWRHRRQPMQSPLASREYCLRAPNCILLKIIKYVPSVFYHPCTETGQEAHTQFNSKGKILWSIVLITNGVLLEVGEKTVSQTPFKTDDLDSVWKDLPATSIS